MKKILIPLPDLDFDVTEVAVPWKLFTRAGHRVIFATERGGAAPSADPRLLTGVLFGKLGADPEPKAFYAELTRAPEFNAPLAWASLHVADYDALVLPGGHAPGMRQYLGSSLLQSTVADYWKLERPVAAICHGVLALARSQLDGKSVLYDSRTTCLTKPQERTAYFITAWKLGTYYRTYPAYVEDEVRAALKDPAKQFTRGPLALTARGTDSDDHPAFVVEDGRYLSARWPGDAYLFAKRLLARL
jgi:putative intracellular protease/amidase